MSLASVFSSGFLAMVYRQQQKLQIQDQGRQSPIRPKKD